MGCGFRQATSFMTSRLIPIISISVEDIGIYFYPLLPQLTHWINVQRPVFIGGCNVVERSQYRRTPLTMANSFLREVLDLPIALFLYKQLGYCWLMTKGLTQIIADVEKN
jgi:hypothetical protein